MGRSSKPLGGFAGLGEAMAFATELQGDGTLHGHGFVALANAWSLPMGWPDFGPQCGGLFMVATGLGHGLSP